MAKKKTEVELTPKELAEKEVTEAKEKVSKKMKKIQEDTQPEATVAAKVKDCERLNVRMSPRANATVGQVISKGDALKVFKDGSTANFYKVVTDKGVVGFCMKKYIKVEK